MKITETEKFNELTPETGFSLYIKADMPLYKDSYFCKIMYCPKTMTIEKAQEDFGELSDTEISNLPERPEPAKEE